MKKLNLLGISGSIRKQSYNTSLLHAMSDIAPGNININIFEKLSQIPIFDPDLDDDSRPDILVQLQKLIKQNDVVVFCTPEYAHNISGVLKNLLDWLVSCEEIILKPTVAISVSTSAMGGARAQSILLSTLNVINTRVLTEASLCIPFAKSKFSSNGELIDPLTTQALSHSLRIIEDNVLN